MIFLTVLIITATLHAIPSNMKNFPFSSYVFYVAVKFTKPGLFWSPSHIVMQTSATLLVARCENVGVSDNFAPTITTTKP